MVETRRLTPEDILGLRKDERMQASWTVMSLLRTIDEEREEAKMEIEEAQLELSVVKQQLKWFEETYSVRAMSPLKSSPTPKGGECRFCSKRSVFGIMEAFMCFDCRRWQDEPVPEVPPEDPPSKSQGDPDDA